MKITPAAPPLQLDLAGFTWPELTILAHHLQYAADRLQQEMDRWRKVAFYPSSPCRKTKTRPHGLMISHWAGLIRDYRYFTFLARAVEVVLDDRCGALFFSDRPLPPLDLSSPLVRNTQYFYRFLSRERRRAQLAVAYIRRETFAESVKQDLLLALDIEIRFFTCLLEWLGPLIPASLIVTGPEADQVPLLFVSLPRVSTTACARIAPQPVDWLSHERW